MEHVPSLAGAFASDVHHWSIRDDSYNLLGRIVLEASGLLSARYLSKREIDSQTEAKQANAARPFDGKASFAKLTPS